MIEFAETHTLPTDLIIPEDGPTAVEAPKPIDLPLTLTVTDLAKLLRIGKNAAYDLVNNGTLKSVRIGRKIRIPRIEFLRYLGMAA